MATIIDGEAIVDRFEIWSIRRPDPETGELKETVYEDKDEATCDLAFSPGILWVRQGFASEGREVEPYE